MKFRAFQITVLLVFFSSMLGIRAGEIPAAEKTKIEALLTHVEGLSGATFTRNGKDYDCKSAAKFLRRKWEANEEKINSAADFIAVAASQSSTSGKPYLIRITNTTPTPCGEYLTTQLKKIEEGKADK